MLAESHFYFHGNYHTKHYAIYNSSSDTQCNTPTTVRSITHLPGIQPEWKFLIIIASKSAPTIMERVVTLCSAGV